MDEIQFTTENGQYQLTNLPALTDSSAYYHILFTYEDSKGRVTTEEVYCRNVNYNETITDVEYYIFAPIEQGDGYTLTYNEEKPLAVQVKRG